MSRRARPMAACAALAIAAAAGVVASEASAQPPARGVVFGGTTGAGEPTVVELAPSGTRLRRLTFTVTAPCRSGEVFTFFFAGSVPLLLDSSGRYRGTNTRQFGIGSGYVARVRLTVHGRISGLRASGGWRLEAEMLDPDGELVDSCGQRETYKAVSAPGRVFGGRTAQQGAVVVELAPDGLSVRRIGIAWRTTCRPSGGFTGHDAFEAVSLEGGRFTADAVGVDPATPELGVKTSTITGRVGAGGASGTFRLQTALNPDVPGGCDTGRFRFRARSG